MTYSYNVEITILAKIFVLWLQKGTVVAMTVTTLMVIIPLLALVSLINDRGRGVPTSAKRLVVFSIQGRNDLRII